MSPFGATTTAQGSVSARGGSPATPGVPIVSSTRPSGSNLTTVWPAGLASGYFARSRAFIARMSTTQALPSRSWVILCGKMNRPAPKLFTMLPSLSSLCTGAQLEPAQLSYWKGHSPGGTSGFAPQRSTTHTERPSLSTATALSAPHLRPSGSLPQGAAVRYGLGRLLVGSPSHFHAPAQLSSARTAL